MRCCFFVFISLFPALHSWFMVEFCVRSYLFFSLSCYSLLLIFNERQTSSVHACSNSPEMTSRRYLLDAHVYSYSLYTTVTILRVDVGS